MHGFHVSPSLAEFYHEPESMSAATSVLEHEYQLEWISEAVKSSAGPDFVLKPTN
jgi:hypothetical protein